MYSVLATLQKMLGQINTRKTRPHYGPEQSHQQSLEKPTPNRGEPLPKFKGHQRAVEYNRIQENIDKRTAIQLYFKKYIGAKTPINMITEINVKVKERNTYNHY